MRLCWLLVMLTGAMWAWHPLAGGDDVWAHAAIGRWIVGHQRVPSQTLFQWAHAPIPWVAHSWGSQLTFYFLLQKGGALAIVLFTVALSLLPFALLWRAWSRRMAGQIGLVAPLLFTLALYVSAPRFRPRPELFTALAFTLLLLFLSHWPRQRTMRRWFWLPPLFCVWANFHGAVALGLVLLATTIVGDAVQETVQRWWGARQLIRQEHKVGALPPLHWPLLLLVSISCGIAVFVNPYGWEYRVALKPVAGVMFSKIDEWKPYWVTPFLPRNYVAGEFILWGAAFTTWLTNPNRRWAHLLWLLVMGAAFLMARRQLWLLALTCLCVSTDGMVTLAGLEWRSLFQSLFVRRTRRDGPLYITLGERPTLLKWAQEMPYLGNLFKLPRRFWQRLGQGLVLVLLTIWWLRATPAPQNWRNKGVKDKNLPGGSVALLQRLQPRRLFNDYEYSSYLEWRLGGKPRLYIDLLNAYPDSIMTDYLAMVRPANPEGRKLWERNRPDAAYVRPHERTSALEDTNRWLKSNPNWQKVYDRKDGAVWLRKSFAREVAALLPPPPAPEKETARAEKQPLPSLNAPAPNTLMTNTLAPNASASNASASNAPSLSTFTLNTSVLNTPNTPNSTSP